MKLCSNPLQLLMARMKPEASSQQKRKFISFGKFWKPRTSITGEAFFAENRQAQPLTENATIVDYLRSAWLKSPVFEHLAFLRRWRVTLTHSLANTPVIPPSKPRLEPMKCAAPAVRRNRVR